MSSLSFYPIDVDYVDDIQAPHKALIRIFGSTPEGKTVCAFDNQFEPYFWVIPSNKKHVASISKAILEIELEEGRRIAKATHIESKAKKHLSQDVTALQVFTNNPKDVALLRDIVRKMDNVAQCLESDIPYYKRYLIDKQLSPLSLCTVEGKEIESSYRADHVLTISSVKQETTDMIKEPRMLSFDIEVYNTIKTPNHEKDPILMAAFYGDKGYKKVITWKKFDNAPEHMEFVKDEGELIIAIKDTITQYKPDYLVGYFSEGFDLPYLRGRADKYNIKLDIGIDRSNLRFNKRGETSTVKIVGFSSIDIFKFIRRVMADTLDVAAYDLDTVGKAILGHGKKEKIKVENLWKAWDGIEGDIRDYCDYNLIDAERTYQLAEKMLPNLHEFVKLVGLPAHDVARMSYGQLVENYLLKHIGEFNEIAPNRPFYDAIAQRQQESYTGGYVYTPKAGIYNEIAVLDFKSLYPTIISSHNICPSTLQDTDKHAEKSPAIDETGEKHFYFNTKREGIFPKILKEVLLRRGRIKTMMQQKKDDPVLNARQYSLKILANSFYGYFAFSGARWYCYECAASTTAYARRYITETIKKAEEQGFDILYGDTDSVFLALEKKKTRDDAQHFLESINKNLPELMELELDGFYPRGIFVMKKGDETGAKKKYALLDDHDEIKVTGFETIRGDWSEIAKETQKNVLGIILREEDVDKALTYVKDVVKGLKEKSIPVEKTILKKQLKKAIEDYENIGPHVVVAKKLQERGEQVSSGMTVRYVITEGKGRIGTRAVPADEAKDYDAEYYTNNQVLPAVLRIFDALGYQKTDLTSDNIQKSLGDFQ